MAYNPYFNVSFGYILWGFMVLFTLWKNEQKFTKQEKKQRYFKKIKTRILYSVKKFNVFDPENREDQNFFKNTEQNY